MPTYPNCSYVSAADTDEPTGASYIYCLAAEVRKLKRAAADANDLVASFPIMAPFTACDPYWDNVVLAMHMDSEVQSALALVIADGYASKHYHEYDISETSYDSWDGYFGEYGTNAVLGYAYTAGASVEDTGVQGTKTIEFDPTISYRFRCYNQSWGGDKADVDLEFLDASDSVVCAIRNIDSSNYLYGYGSDLYYGSSLSSLTLAPQYNSGDGAVTTTGYITCSDTAITFTSDTVSTYSNNQSFSFNCAANTITKVRISNARAISNYTGGTGAAFVSLFKRKQISDIKGHATMVYGSAAIVTDVDMVGGKAGSFNGSSRIVVADSDDFTLTGDFGIELQAKATDGTAYRSVLSNITLNADSWANGVEIFTKDGVWKATLYDSGASLTTVIGPAATTAKQHVSLCRVGSTVTLYVDGVGGTGVTWANTLNAKGITIGTAWDTATRGWVGKVNQVIMYKNTSPRTADFTTPTEPFAEVAC
jgi:hypothetical protein